MLPQVTCNTCYTATIDVTYRANGATRSAVLTVRVHTKARVCGSMGLTLSCMLLGCVCLASTGLVRYLAVVCPELCSRPPPQLDVCMLV